MIKESKVLGKSTSLILLWNCSSHKSFLFFFPSTSQMIEKSTKGFESRRPPPTSWMRALCRSTLRAFMILTIAACKYILRSSSTALLVCSISCWSDGCATRFKSATRLANNNATAKLDKDGFVWPVVCLSALMLWSWTLSFYWWNSYLVKTWTRFQSPPAGRGGEKEYISPLVWSINAKDLTGQADSTKLPSQYPLQITKPHAVGYGIYFKSQTFSESWLSIFTSSRDLMVFCSSFSFIWVPSCSSL